MNCEIHPEYPKPCEECRLNDLAIYGVAVTRIEMNDGKVTCENINPADLMAETHEQQLDLLEGNDDEK